MPQAMDRKLIRMCRYTSDTIVAGVAPFNFVINEDVDGYGLPFRFRISRIVIIPSISTIRALRFFTKSTRISTGGNADCSLVYEDTWTDATSASIDPTFDSTEVSYYNEDRDGKIYGSLGIKAAANNAKFTILIFFEE